MNSNITAQLRLMAPRSFMAQDTRSGNYVRVKFNDMEPDSIEVQLVLNSKNVDANTRKVSWLKLLDIMIMNNIGFHNIYMLMLTPTESDRAIQRRIKKFMVEYSNKFGKLSDLLIDYDNDYSKFRADAISKSKASKPVVSQSEIDAKNIKDASEKIKSHIAKLTQLVKDNNQEVASEAAEELKQIDQFSKEFRQKRPRGTYYELLNYIQSKGFIL